MKLKLKKIDWLNHFLEFSVVIIGILLAFQLNKCSSDKTQRQLIETHLTQIKEETKINKHSILSSIKYDEENLIKLDSVINLIQKKENFDIVNNLSLELLNLGGVYIRKNAYLNLTETGDIKFISDFSQKERVISLYEFYNWVQSFNDISMNLYREDYYPYLRDNFDLVGGTTRSVEIYTSKKFQNILGAYYRTSQNRLQKYKECLVEIDKYLQNNENK